MLNIFDKKPFQTVILIGLIILVLELIFSNSNQFVWVILAGVVAYYSWQQFYRPPNQVIFWISIVVLVSILFDQIYFRVIFGVIFIWFIIYYMKNQSEEKEEATELRFSEEPIEEKEILYANKWFGRQTRGEAIYQWQDFNSQTVIGETVIDLTQTVLPKDEPVILVRHFAGTIKIIVPYDVEVSINHSVLIGSVDIFGYGYDHVTNRVIHYQTENYQKASQRIKIYTSIVAGKIEVIRR